MAGINSAKQSRVYTGLTILLLLIFNSTLLFAGSATLSWNPPASNADGSDLTDLGGYKIYVGSSPDKYTQSFDAGNVTTYKLNDLTDGSTYYFAVTAYDTSGNESRPSNSTSFTLPTGSSSWLGTPKITSPEPGSTLAAETETFQWSDNGAPVSAWGIEVGSSPGDSDIFCGGGGCDPANDQKTGMAVTGLPTDGSTIFVRLWYNTGTWQHEDFEYSAAALTPYPEITVNDSVAPVDDLQVLFGDITEFNTADQTVTVINDGRAELVIDSIAPPDQSSTPFSIFEDGCSYKRVAPKGVCSFKLRFAPITTGAFASSITIHSNDANEAKITVAVSGNGLSSETNNPPSEPVLVSPKNRGKGGENGSGGKVGFKWKKAQDPDGDSVTYELNVCQDSAMTTGCETQILAARTDDSTVYYAGIGSIGGSMMFLGMIFVLPFRARRHKILPLLILSISLSGMLFLVSCGGGSGGDANSGIVSLDDTAPLQPDEISRTVPDLERQTTYYWQVVAQDENGAKTYSAIWSFETL